ncbi:metal-dependent hydrolase [Microbacterium xylanilyticum]
MMGTSHAVTGAAAWVAITATTLPALHLYPVTPVGVVLGAMVCAGAALLPDADHHDATIAHSVPVLGRVTAGTVERISGGHRHGMHSLLAVIGILAATIALSTLRWTPTGWDHPIQLGSAIAVMACVTFATRVLTLVRSWPAAWALGTAAAVLVALWAPAEFTWLPVCIGLGFAVHLIGDALTTEGIPLLWPLNPRPPKPITRTPVLRSIWKRNGYLAIPILGNAGSVREWLLMLPIAGYAAWGIATTALQLINGVSA